MEDLDCRVVLSGNGVAEPLTNDHRLGREDKRSRIENSVSKSCQEFLIV